MAIVENRLAPPTTAGALARRLAASASTEPAGRFALLCRAQAVTDVGLLEDALIELLAIPGTTAGVLDVVAAAIAAHRR